METMTISVAEYKALVEKATAFEAKIDSFAGYVNNHGYAVERSVCGAILGFEVEDVFVKS